MEVAREEMGGRVTGWAREMCDQGGCAERKVSENYLIQMSYYRRVAGATCQIGHLSMARERF